MDFKHDQVHRFANGSRRLNELLEEVHTVTHALTGIVDPELFDEPVEPHQLNNGTSRWRISRSGKKVMLEWFWGDLPNDKPEYTTHVLNCRVPNFLLYDLREHTNDLLYFFGQSLSGYTKIRDILEADIH